MVRYTSSVVVLLFLTSLLFSDVSFALMKVLQPSEGKLSQSYLSEIEAEWHEEGKKYPAVCAILVNDRRLFELKMSTGTVIATREGRGYVLTAASPLVGFSANQVYLSFGEDFKVTQRARADKIDFHPQFSVDRKKIKSNENNLAIIEFSLLNLNTFIPSFPTDGAQEYFRESFQEYFQDYFQEYFKDELRIGTLVGFGSFGAAIDSLENLHKIHAAQAWVALTRSSGSKLNFFQSVSFLAPSGPSQLFSAIQFDPIGTSIQAATSPPSSPIIASQVGHPTEEDIGGPLLLPNQDRSQLRVAGVLRGLDVRFEAGPLGRSQVKRLEAQWEPIYLHWQWIQQIVNGSTDQPTGTASSSSSSSLSASTPSPSLASSSSSL